MGGTIGSGAPSVAAAPRGARAAHARRRVQFMDAATGLTQIGAVFTPYFSARGLSGRAALPRCVASGLRGIEPRRIHERRLPVDGAANKGPIDPAPERRRGYRGGCKAESETTKS